MSNSCLSCCVFMAPVTTEATKGCDSTNLSDRVGVSEWSRQAHIFQNKFGLWTICRVGRMPIL